MLLVNCDPEAVTALIRDHLERAAEGGEHTDDPLSPRESEVIKLIAEGHTSKEIAELLVISEKTVERHRSNILDKLGLRDRVDMTRYAIRRGLASPDRGEAPDAFQMGANTHCDDSRVCVLFAGVDGPLD